MQKIIKKQEGITLVALIITIIVMVILAGIIITSAVSEGGIIDRTQEAMKQSERADIQEIIISSYFYKLTASTSTVVALDLEKTGMAIYKNLDANGFKVLTATEAKDKNGEIIYENGKIVWTVPITTEENENQIMDINVQGKHGEYTGQLNNSGLVKDLEIVEENQNEEVEEDEEVEDTTPVIPENANPPVDNNDNSEIGNLELLKIYRDQDISLVFFENKVFIGDRFGAALSYTYNKEEKTILINAPSPIGTLTGILSDDGKINSNILGTNYSFSIVEGETEFLQKHGVYEGVYYNKAKQKYACVMKDHTYDQNTEISIWFENENWSISRTSGSSYYIVIPESSEGKTIKYANNVLNPDGDKYLPDDFEILEYTLLGENINTEIE